MLTVFDTEGPEVGLLVLRTGMLEVVLPFLPELVAHLVFELAWVGVGRQEREELLVAKQVHKQNGSLKAGTDAR